MNKMDGEPSVDVGGKGFMDKDIILRHRIHQNVVRSIESIPYFDVFPYGTEL